MNTFIDQIFAPSLRGLQNVTSYEDMESLVNEIPDVDGHTFIFIRARSYVKYVRYMREQVDQGRENEILTHNGFGVDNGYIGTLRGLPVFTNFMVEHTNGLDMPESLAVVSLQRGSISHHHLASLFKQLKAEILRKASDVDSSSNT